MKYELVADNVIAFEDKTLYQIRALMDFADVKAQDLGGFVESTFNLVAESEERRVGKECRSRWSPYH